MHALILVASLTLTQTPWSDARWIWDQPNANQGQQTNDPRFIRRVFELAENPASAELWVTADNFYHAYVNGQSVGSDSEWATVEKIDVTKHLVKGKNLLAFEAKNMGGAAGFIARLAVRGADGKEIIIASGDTFLITQQPGADWKKLDADTSTWKAASVLGEAGIGPWNLTGGAKVAGGQKTATPAVTQTRLTAEEQLKHFTVPKDFAVELVVADPLVINPVTMIVDDKGRILLSESHTYRYGAGGSPIKPFKNPVIRLDPLPDGKGFERTLIADGFDDPVMGMALKDGQLWLTANNFLYRYDLPETGPATNKTTLVIDKNKAWNPFGMFVVEFGPDGLLYMSVGNHAIKLEGPDGSMSGRGSSGIVLSMKPDGSQMRRLVHGLRVPYSFEYDPFGQLWVLSNGEGNPNRFLRVLDGVDYHCYSRNIDNGWLAGEHPLAPPCFELPRGAHTQLMRYYGAAYPSEYQGALLLDNWGAHGFNGINRAIFRYQPDARGDIGLKESFVACADPHFRPSHIALDAEGNLLVADWYGRDDESDLTGRIWRVRYTGPKPATPTFDWTKDADVIRALGSPHHLDREKALLVLRKKGPDIGAKLRQFAADAKEPLGAAGALWLLLQRGETDGISAGLENPDWKVRRLAVNLQRRLEKPDTKAILAAASKDADLAVRLEACIALGEGAEQAKRLLEVLNAGAANDPHLRYEAAWHLAKSTQPGIFEALLASEEANIRLAGSIAIDIACYEGFPSKPQALATLGKFLDQPGKNDLAMLLHLAQINNDQSLTGALEKLVIREDLPAAVSAKAFMVLRAKAGISPSIGKRFLQAVEQGTIKLSSPSDQVTLLELLEGEGPTPFALKHLGSQLQTNQPQIRQAAHALARKFGAKASPVASLLWSQQRSKNSLEENVETISTLALIDQPPTVKEWQKLLHSDTPALRTEAVRWWRQFKDQPALVDLLAKEAPNLAKADSGLGEDAERVLTFLRSTSPPPPADKDALAKSALKDLAAWSKEEQKVHALQGRQVFERTGCTKCHTTVTQNTLLAPSLKGIAAQKVDYLLESVLYPSKIIKTGFETETIVTSDGKILNGLVKDEGKFLRVLNLDKEVRVQKGDIESRAVQKRSIMPEGQEALLSRREFSDLIAYLLTLK